jgi:hypothetical protein
MRNHRKRSQRPRKYGERKEITPPSTPSQVEESLSPNSPDTQEKQKRRKQGRTLPRHTPPQVLD